MGKQQGHPALDEMLHREAQSHRRLPIHSEKTLDPHSAVHDESLRPVAIQDVLVGEDWVGSGQSNMAFTISSKVAPWAGIKDEDKEIEAANYPRLRLFIAEPRKSYEPQTEIRGEWKIATPENAPTFTAVAYLFGRNLQRALNVPVGMVVAAYGASTAESWISRPAISADTDLQPLLTHFDDLYHYFQAHPGGTTH